MSKAILRLTFSNIWTIVEGGPNLLKRIDDILTFKVPGCEFSPLYKKKIWDGKKHFFRKKTGLVQTGLLPYILRKLPRDKVGVQFIDKRILPFDLEKLPGRLKGRWPRLDVADWQRSLDHVHFRSNIKKVEYQVEAVNALIHHNLEGIYWPRGILSASVASGKSLMAAALIKTLNLPTLFTVHRLDLVAQVKEVFEMIFDPKDIGQIGGGKFELDKKITVSSIQTLSSRLKKPEMVKFLQTRRVWIVDEAHAVADNAYYKVSNVLKRAFYRYGFTGSSFKRTEIDNMFSRSVFGDEVFSLKSSKLIQDGMLAKPIIHMLEFSKLKSKDYGLPTYAPPKKDNKTIYHEYYKKIIAENEERNMLIAEIAQDCVSKEQKTLILVTRIDHGDTLHALISPFLPCEFLSGRDDPETRKTTLKKFKNSFLNCLIMSSIGDVGIDLPSVNVLILGGAGKSEVSSIQRIGRGLRLSEGKTHVDIYDFYDKTYPFNEHSKARMNTYHQAGFEFVIREVL